MLKIIIPLLIFQLNSYAQKKVFFSWSYNRSWHSKSDVKFQTKDGTFYVDNASGQDRPSDFSLKNYFSLNKIFIPQYNLKIGYQVRPNLAIVIGTDHMKWIFDNDKNYTISGDYNGATYDTKAKKPIVWDSVKSSGNASWLEYEHSDGYNYVYAGAEFSQNIFSFYRDKFSLQLREGTGLGVLITKTKTEVYRGPTNKEVLDNPFKMTGYGAHLSLSSRLLFLKKLFLELEFKTTLIKVYNAPFLGKSGEKVSHSPIFSLQSKIGMGYIFTF